MKESNRLLGCPPVWGSRTARSNRRNPGTTIATQTPPERAALRQCRKQGLWPVASTPDGDVIAMWRGQMFYNPSADAPFARVRITGAIALYRWMLDNSERVTTHESGDDMGYTACQTMRWMKIGYCH